MNAPILYPSLLVPLVFATLSLADEGPYPRPDLLLEPAALAKAPKRFVVLDARARNAYDAGHVPNARWVDHAAWAKAFGQGKDAAGWGKRIGALGIARDSQVVVYDDSRAKDAARIWWLLRYWGVEDVRLLNGGWVAWKAANHPTEKAGNVPTPAKFEAKARPDRLATKDEILRSLNGDKLQIVDARSEKEFCGEAKLKNPRAGAIPGAKHLEWSDLTDSKSHRFKPASDLRKLFKDAGISLGRPAATYCQSGGRAAVMAFGLELMGADGVSNYYPSWAEWSKAGDTPVVKPKPKSR